jgi:hypothetical protein
MPNWTFLLIIGFVALGLRTRDRWNANAIAVGMTVMVLLFVAVRKHLLA